MGSNYKKVRTPVVAGVLFAIISLEKLINVMAILLDKIKYGGVGVLSILYSVVLLFGFCALTVLLFMKRRDIFIFAASALIVLCNVSRLVSSLINSFRAGLSGIRVSDLFGSVFVNILYLIAYLFSLVAVFMLCEQNIIKTDNSKAKKVFPKIWLVYGLILALLMLAKDLIYPLRIITWATKTQHGLFYRELLRIFINIAQDFLKEMMHVTAMFSFLHWLADPYKKDKPRVQSSAQRAAAPAPDPAIAVNQAPRTTHRASPVSRNEYHAPSPEQEKINLLKQYRELLEGGIITQEEFDAKKKQLLDI